MQLYTVYYISVNCSLYMFRVVTPPIIRSTYNCNHSIWHWSNRLCYLQLSWSSWNPPIIRSTYNYNYSIWHWSNRLCYLPLSWSSLELFHHSGR